ncbi:ShlB/FhaC/HecB family hemolysin secretion/activation protein [Rhodoferax aquaticus]|uniref:ShlB/FhaC/HecB family hemolysin secretion/activation protein n=1 Tax=Rhodoferax aquaticus TaxID=2527691 RepID=UPI001F33C723|nr:ShlB/FhaC/HecB family hemolysin secretion/activation protein [Rhodoferax aquaticus]
MADPAPEQRREQQRVQAQRQELERTAHVTSTASRQDDSLLPTGENPCFKIDHIALDNADYPLGSGAPRPNPIFTETFDWLTSATAGVSGTDSPIGKCLGTAGVQLVIKRGQEAAVAKGYVTTRVLAQRQDLSSGTLVLTVIPGHVGAIRFKATGSDSQDPPGVRTSNAVPLRSGDILNLRDIEQGLENFKRVPTAEADIQIEPAQDANAINQSDLVIAYQQPRMTRWSLSLDDSGSKGTGRYQGSGTFSLDNPLGLSDLFYLTLNHDLNSELGYELGNTQTGDRGTRGYTVHYSLPLDYWTLGTTYSSNRYFQQVVGQNQNYIYSGTSENSEIKLSRLVYRDEARKSTLSLKGWQRKSNNYIDDTEVQNQRRVVGGWELGVNHKDMLGDASVEGNLAYKRGTQDFDSIPAPEEAFGEGTSKLGLLLLDLNVSKPFKAVGQNFRYSAALRLQDNSTPLTPQDRFAIGGRYTVRGFDGESSLVGERGWTLRNDWSMALGDSGHEVYLGLDAGEVSGPSSQNLAGKHLAGGVIGLKGGFKRFKTAVQYDLFVGAPIDKPSGFKTAETTAGCSLSMSF